jgi:hypothetical protein
LLGLAKLAAKLGFASSADYGKQFLAGTVTVTVSSGGSFFTHAVTFGTNLGTTPKITVAIKQGSGGSVAVIGGVVPGSESTSGFTAYVRSGDDGNFGGTANYDIDWIAVG